MEWSLFFVWTQGRNYPAAGDAYAVSAVSWSALERALECGGRSVDARGPPEYGLADRGGG